ncbi:BET1 homolog isoform X2 [Apostichopus japonicus]|uniref:BET1 homolog isoform X2 n=1 Tax=Stichopus japonicus TaxID=307972 RepID=UPI003AB83D5A
MRRAAGHTGASQNGGGSYSALEEENDRLVNDLNPKVAALKHISIEIGAEVRAQNKMLVDMDDDFGKSGGLLERTMGRLQKLTKAGHHCTMFYLLLFCLFVFFVLYLIIKSR